MEYSQSWKCDGCGGSGTAKTKSKSEVFKVNGDPVILGAIMKQHALKQPKASAACSYRDFATEPLLRDENS